MSNSKSKSRTFLNNKRTLSTNSKDLNESFQIQNQALNKGPWTEKEDQLLNSWVSKYGACNWTKCSEFIKGRSGKQCREHWNNALDPQLTKGQWTPEEDLLIMIFYKKYGGSWKRIIPIFQKRTENSIKNRFFSQLRKIASKSQQAGKKEYSTKFGLDTLKKYLSHGTELAKKKFFEEKKMKESELEDYINKIDNLVKNRKKGNKFIDLKLIKDNKKSNNNLININEDKEENNNEKDEDLETINNKRKRKGRKKYIEQSKNKEESKNKEQKNNIEVKKISNETINVNNSKKNTVLENNNNNINNNINKTFQKRNSKKKNIFKNENMIETKNTNYSEKNIVQTNNNNDINNSNYKSMLSNNKKISKDFNSYKIKPVDPNKMEEDVDSKDSIEELHLIEQINNNDDKTIEQYKSKHKYIRCYNSRNIYNRIKKGKNISPFISYDNIEYKEGNINPINKKSNKNEEKIEKKSSKDFKYILRKNFFTKNSFGNISDLKIKNSLNFSNNLFDINNSKLIDIDK